MPVTLQVSDKLRDMLLNTESDNAELYNSRERAELLFCVFEHLCLGGAMNQFEVSLYSMAPLVYCSQAMTDFSLGVQASAFLCCTDNSALPST